jgi:acetyl esterase/lipase
MMDAIAMLQWVKRNIAAFGGDPNKVTIAGESAARAMVGALVDPRRPRALHPRHRPERRLDGTAMARCRPRPRPRPPASR